MLTEQQIKEAAFAMGNDPLASMAENTWYRNGWADGYRSAVVDADKEFTVLRAALEACQNSAAALWKDNETSRKNAEELGAKRYELFATIERLTGKTLLESELDEIGDRFKAYTYLVFDANGKFYCSLQMKSDKDFERWNEQTKKKGLQTVSIRVYTDNRKTTYGRLSDIHLK